MKNIVIKPLSGPTVSGRQIEMVERKGLGHPDTICDAVSEIASQTLSRYYVKNFGTVLHHNLDKGLLIAGQSQPKFGGGKIVKPIQLIIAGRATNRVGKFKIPVEDLVTQAAKKYLSKTLNFSAQKIEKIFKIKVAYQEGAANLQEVFKRNQKIAIANDTSFGVAYAPLSPTEQLTLSLANYLNSKNVTKKYPWLGKDLKVMTLRKGATIYVTVALAFLDKFIQNIDDYFRAKEEVRRAIESYLQTKFDFKSVVVALNVLDAPQAQTASDVYLTCTGLSAEQGDDGEVGRGNRIDGLITPLRQMTLEAASGKNINHPGKLYQVLAQVIAQKVGKLEGVEECYVKLLSQIGQPLDEPQIALVELKAQNFSQVKVEATRICEETLNQVAKIQRAIIQGKYQLF